MKSNHIKLLTGIFLFALGIRIGFLLLFPEVGWLNYQYDTIGWNLAQGHGYSMDPEPPYTPSAYRPPVYPFMLHLRDHLIQAFKQRFFFVDCAHDRPPFGLNMRFGSRCLPI